MPAASSASTSSRSRPRRGGSRSRWRTPPRSRTTCPSRGTGRTGGERLTTERAEGLWWPAVRDILGDCDAVVCNLECCISERGRRTRAIRGKPFFFRGPPAAVTSLTAIGVSVAGLANNHALDFGPEALLDTLSHLRGAGITTVGAGPDDHSARRGEVVSV